MTDVQTSASDVQILMSYHLVSFFALTHSRPTHARALSCRLLGSAIHVVVCIHKGNNEHCELFSTGAAVNNAISTIIKLVDKKATHTHTQSEKL